MCWRGHPVYDCPVRKASNPPAIQECLSNCLSSKSGPQMCFFCHVAHVFGAACLSCLQSFLSLQQTEFRFYWLQSKVQEADGLSEIAKRNPVGSSTRNRSSPLHVPFFLPSLKYSVLFEAVEHVYSILSFLHFVFVVLYPHVE